jgi:16S rRNA processing protein RimM
MNQDEFFQVGKVVKLNGSTGELLFILDTEYIASLKKLESVFIQLHGNLIPFFIDSFRMKANNQALVKLLDVDSTEDMTSFQGCGVFLPESSRPRKSRGTSNSPDLNGFKVTDISHGALGIVVNVLELPMQELLEIDFNGKQILIPLVEEIIKHIDMKGKVITIEAPEGLIEIYI